MSSTPALLPRSPNIPDWTIAAVGLLVFYLGWVAVFLALFFPGLILIVTGAGIMLGRKLLAQFFTSPTVADTIAEANRQRALENEALATATMQSAEQYLTLGTVEESDYFPAHIGITTEGNVCRIAEYLLDRHFFCVGEIGAGKTTSLLTFMQQTAKVTNRDIFFINYKGQEDDNEKARQILFPYRGNVRIIRIDPDNPGFRYNPFKYGDGLAVANRWIRILGLHQMEGNAEYYADLHRAVIFMMCLQGEPPRTLAEMAKRLEPTGTWLTQAFPKGHPKRWMVDLLIKEGRGEPSAWQKFGIKLIPFMEQLERFIGEDGLTFDDGSLIFSVPSSKIPDTAKLVADCLVEDLKHFMSARQRRPAFICWDEFQAARNETITEFLGQARSFRCGAVLATQDINKLGNDLQQKILTSDTTTLISFRTQQSAEFVAKMAGTIEAPVVTVHLVGLEAGEEGSVRTEQKWHIDPNEVARLPDGYAYIVRQRTVAKVRVHLPQIPEGVPPEEVYIPPPPPAPEVEAKPKRPQVKKFN